AATITGKRLNAYGALTCRDTTLLAPLQPFGATGTVGTPVSLAALHINCGKPGGIVTVTVQPDGAVVTLSDDGAGSDQAADDGIYSGQWTPVRPGTYTFTFPNGDTTDFVVLDNYSPSPVLYNYR